MTYLAAKTTTLRLGTAVMTLPWHNPVLLAEQAATLDLVSEGRLDFGVGKGYRYNEFHGFGVDMVDADEIFEEALTLILKSWQTEERWSHMGKHCQFNEIVVEPPTVQEPHLPIWLAAGRPTCGEPNRQMRFLDSRRFDDDLIELTMFAHVAPPFFSLPGLQNEGQGFLENLVGIHHVDTEAVKLVVAIPLTDTEIEAPLGDKIQCRRLFRQQNRIVPREGHDGGAEAQCRRLCRKVRHQVERRRNLARFLRRST